MNLRVASLALFALAFCSNHGLAAPPASGVIVRGDLLTDLRPDTTADSTEWVNHVNGGKTVGNFSRLDKARLAVTTITAPNGKAEVKTVRFNGEAVEALLSSRKVPVEVTGTGSISVEAWFKAPGTVEDHGAVVGYGVRPGNGNQREFIYGKAKPFSGFFADVGDWGTFTPDADSWHYLVWVYDGESKSLYVYVDGKEVSRGNPELDTAASPLVVGASPTENSAGKFTNDPLSGYLACLRAETGVLSADDVQKNYAAGIDATPARK